MVPNAPCGVESEEFKMRFPLLPLEVPNAPCGVERIPKTPSSITTSRS